MPTSPDVWARAILTAPERELVLAFGVATTAVALEETLRAFGDRCRRLDDDDGVAYQFLLG